MNYYIARIKIVNYIARIKNHCQKLFICLCHSFSIKKKCPGNPGQGNRREFAPVKAGAGWPGKRSRRR